MILSEKVALVTGAASGLGRAIAETFAREGARVLVHDLKQEAHEVAEAIGGSALLADLTDAMATRHLVDQALAITGRVDILVNNAGFQHVSPVEEFPEEVWNKMLQVMLTTPF